MRTSQLAAAVALVLLPLTVAAIAQDEPAPPPVPTETPEPAKAEEPAEPSVKIEVLAEGEGEVCGNGRAVLVHYDGRFTDGKEFDSSRKRDEPLPVLVGADMVIKGWDQTLAKMRIGDRWKVTIPYQLAYGERGNPPAIPAKSDLVFDMEMLEWVEPAVEFTKKGEGAALEKGDTIEAHFSLVPVAGEAMLDTRTQRGGEPAMLSVGRLTGLVGLDMLLPRLRVGDRIEATIPSSIAFGKRGNPPRVAPDTDLVLDLEVLQVIAPDISWTTRGEGAQAESGQRVTVHYTGTLPDGTKFDSSRDKDKPYSFVLGRGQVIAGWDLTLKQMKVGDRVLVTIPYQLAYGPAGKPPRIPPKSPLIFDIELLSVE